MSSKLFLFLDFDGVICDSLDECFISSWIAFHHYYRQQKPRYVPLADKKRFCNLRPFVRDGQDYLLIHELVEQGKSVSSQEEFDTCLKQAGGEKMQQYKQLFYRARNHLIENDFDFWCRINTLFPHMAGLLAGHAENPRLFILSTKKPEYIVQILKYHKIAFEPARVLHPGNGLKMTVIKRILAEQSGTEAVFVDDQIDHFIHDKDSRIVSYLPSWGYIKKEWLSSGCRILYPDTVERVFNLK